MPKKHSSGGGSAAAAESSFDDHGGNADNRDADDPEGGFLTAFQWVPQGFIQAVPKFINKNPVGKTGSGSGGAGGAAAAALARRLGISKDEADQMLGDDDTLAAGGNNNNNNDDDDDDDNDDYQQKRGGGGGDSRKARGVVDFIVGGQAADSILQELESDDEDEIDDTTIRPTDLVFVVTRAGEDPNLEVTIYDEPRDNIYVHHDATLVAPPLCLEWLYQADNQSSLVAVGSMHPYIEIWNIDVADAVDPVAVLGGCEDPGDNYARGAFSSKKKKRSSAPQLKADSHTDAVTSLRWNTAAPAVLASGGADALIKVWDVNGLRCIGTTPHPSGARVQTLDWSPRDANVLLCGCGSNLDVIDCRTPDAPVVHWSTGGDGGAAATVEKAMFAPARDGNYIFGSTSHGVLALFDTRRGSNSAPVWVLEDLHGGDVVFDISKHSPLLATGGAKDGISLWQLDGDNLSSCPPQQLCHRRLGVGQCFSLQFHPNSAEVLGGAGSAGKPLVYTITNDVNVGRAKLNKKNGGGGGDDEENDDDDRIEKRRQSEQQQQQAPRRRKKRQQ